MRKFILLQVFSAIIAIGLASSVRAGSESAPPQQRSICLMHHHSKWPLRRLICSAPSAIRTVMRSAHTVNARGASPQPRATAGCAAINFIFRRERSRFFAGQKTTTSASPPAFYNFVQPQLRLIPYVSGGVGLGWIDSTDTFGGQGQDFTFNVLAAGGVSYKLNDHWKASGGILYQHLSNGGQTDPNPSLNLFGPQVGVTYSF
jgi:hypothetical protein